MEVAKKQQKELLKTKKELEIEKQKEMEFQAKLKKEEKGRKQAILKFNSLQEELDFTT